MKSIKCVVPQQAGWIEVELDDDEIDFLWKSIENKGRDEKPYLAGNIDSSRALIDTGDWDNSLATNSPGQSGDPDSKFYDNLYEDWANDSYFPLLYSKSKILRNLENRKVYYPQD